MRGVPFFYCKMLWISNIDIFVKLQLDCHPVAAVQYTFTHKQYTEQHN